MFRAIRWMIIRHSVAVFIVLTTSLSLTPSRGTAAASGNESAMPGGLPHNLSHTLNGVTFQYPSTYFRMEPFPGLEDKGALLLHKQYECGLFVFVPSETFKSEEFVQRLRTSAIDKLLPQEPKKFAWKSLEDTWKISKYQTQHGRSQGFNKRRRVIVQYYQLNFKGKSIVAGYFFALPHIPEDEELFQNGLGGESMPASQGCIVIIGSITGEKIEEGEIRAVPVRKP